MASTHLFGKLVMQIYFSIVYVNYLNTLNCWKLKICTSRVIVTTKKLLHAVYYLKYCNGSFLKHYIGKGYLDFLCKIVQNDTSTHITGTLSRGYKTEVQSQTQNKAQ